MANALIEAFEDQSCPIATSFCAVESESGTQRLEATLWLPSSGRPNPQRLASIESGTRSKEALVRSTLGQQNVAAYRFSEERNRAVLISTLRNPPSHSDVLKALQRSIQLGLTLTAVPALIDA